MSYLDTMMTLLITEMQDQGMQNRLDLARVECGMDQRLQHQLDIKQTALTEARIRNLTRIAEIASMN